MPTPNPNYIALVAAFITGVIGPVVVRLILRWLEKTTDPLKEAITLAEKVSDKLEELKEDYDADRIYILQFHNGGHYYPTGKSIQKFSMLYEVVSDSKFSGQQTFQNIPVNLFSRSLKHLTNEDVICIPDYEDPLALTYGLKFLAQENGSKSSYLFSIRNIDGRFIGVLGVEYSTKCALSDHQLSDLQVAASAIGGELSKYLRK